MDGACDQPMLLNVVAMPFHTERRTVATEAAISVLAEPISEFFRHGPSRSRGLLMLRYGGRSPQQPMLSAVPLARPATEAVQRVGRHDNRPTRQSQYLLGSEYGFPLPPAPATPCRQGQDPCSMLPRHHVLRHGAVQPNDVRRTDPPGISRVTDRNRGQRVSSDDRVGVGSAGTYIFKLEAWVIV